MLNLNSEFRILQKALGLPGLQTNETTVCTVFQTFLMSPVHFLLSVVVYAPVTHQDARILGILRAGLCNSSQSASMCSPSEALGGGHGSGGPRPGAPWTCEEGDAAA